MTLEMTASRLIAPYFGSSIITWSILISAIMISLCIGAKLGGKCADKWPNRHALALILYGLAIIIAVLPLICDIVLTYITSHSAPLYFAAAIGVTILFLIPGSLAGTVGPWAMKLSILNIQTSGQSIGDISFANTLGSIIGTILGGLIFVIYLPLWCTLLVVSGLLLFGAWIVYPKMWKEIVLAYIAISSLGAYIYFNGLPGRNDFIAVETLHNTWFIKESKYDGKIQRHMQTDPYLLQSTVFVEDPVTLATEYTKYFELAFCINPDVKRILMIGGGGYTVPRYLLSKYNVSMDIVEIDPMVTEMAKQYFFLTDSKNMRIFHEDGHVFLKKINQKDSAVKYDAIFIDVYSTSYTPPFHLCTAETASLVRNALTPDGLCIFNLISRLEPDRRFFLDSMYSTFKTAFTHIDIYPVKYPDEDFIFKRNTIEKLRQSLLRNMILIASNKPLHYVNSIPSCEPFLNFRWQDPPLPSVKPFTNQYAPVEYNLFQ